MRNRALAVIACVLVIANAVALPLVASTPASAAEATASGEVVLTGESATNGSTYTYSLADATQAENFTVELTGHKSIERESASASALADGDTLPFTVAGTTAPENVSVTFTGTEETRSASWSGTVSDGATDSISVGGNVEATNASVTFTGRENTTADSWSASSQSDGQTQSISVGGNVAPKNAQVTFTGNGFGSRYDNLSQTGLSASGSVSLSVEGSLDPTDGNGGDPSLKVTGYSGGYQKSFNISSQGDYPSGIAFGDSGTKMYVSGEDVNEIHQYALSTAYDVSSASYSESLDIGSLTSHPKDVSFGDSGTKMYIITGADYVYQFELSTAYDLSSASYTKQYDVSGQETNPGGLDIADSGTKMYVTGDSEKILQYSLSTAYDVTSASYSKSFDVSSKVGLSAGIQFTSDGSKMHVVDNWDSTIYHYSLSTAYDVSSATYSESTYVGDQDNGPGGIAFSDDKTQMFVVGVVDDNVYQYSIGGPTDLTVSDGDGHTVSFGDLTDGQTKQKSIPLTTSSTKLDFSASSGGLIDVQLTMQEQDSAKNPSIDVDGDGSADGSYSGMLSNGETASTSLSSLPSGSVSVTTSVSGAPVDWSISADEVNATENPKLDVGADGSFEASYAGVLRSGQTETVDIGNLSTGSNTVAFSTANATSTKWSLTATERDYTEDPGIDLDGDGFMDLRHNGILSPGESSTVTASLSLGAYSAEIDTAGESATAVNVNYTEVSETENAAVIINGHEVPASGTLSEGESTSLDVSADLLQNGENTVTIEVAPNLSADAPTALVDMAYSHTAQTSQTSELNSTAWRETRTVTKTFAGNRSDASIALPFHESVVSVKTAKLSRNGDNLTAIDPSDYEFVNGNIVVNLGSVSKGDTISVQGVGRRVKVHNGDIEIVEPTLPGNALDTKVRIQKTGSGFAIETNSGQVLRAYEESWDNPNDYSLVTASGTQRLSLPNAGNDSTARVEYTPLEVIPERGDAKVSIEDLASRQFHVEGGRVSGDTVKLRWLSVVEDKQYALWSVTHQDTKAVSKANAGGVTFTEDDSPETFEVVKSADAGDSDGIGGPFGLGQSVQSGMVLVLVAGSVIGTYWAQRRWGNGLNGTRDWLVLGMVATATTALGIEIVAPGTLAGLLTTGPVPFVIAAVAGLIVIYYGTAYLPGSRKLRFGYVAVSVGVIGVIGLEVLSPGSVTDTLGPTLASGLDPAIRLGGLVAVGLAGYGGWKWLTSGSGGGSGGSSSGSTATIVIDDNDGGSN
ncbi:hypothetical protein ELS19_17185 [Halogeometricum borinquense]|uniref:Uncharacterized protein n=1 Tax=Halogeometricum borinquense TaxID=60847 RepID=A0A482T8P7_9EURY|nr:hypothetical protein [Halogeometricum borinquense]RYJ08289.1 hypothetical protein ELS19_17185 [Halogeometricum borinquense]